MVKPIDHSHDPEAISWVPGADQHPDFPIQNLPLGVFERGGDGPRIGCAIGDFIFDLAAFSTTGTLPEQLAQACRSNTLNAIFALPRELRSALRHHVFDVLHMKNRGYDFSSILYPAVACHMFLPAQIGDYTDFYIGIHHATNIGKLFRPENPLLPNYKHLPIAYHGRASTIGVSPDHIMRPCGQQRTSPEAAPIFGPSTRLDYEVELGVWIAGDNRRGEVVPIANADDRVAGLCMLNDWSARDLQAWEYQPLGPFLSKNFASTISPWVVTAEALAPFRIAAPKRGVDDPAPLPYLNDHMDQNFGGYSIQVDCFLSTAKMKQNGLPPTCLSSVEMRDAAYWTIAQMIAHHSVNGCALKPGDLLGTGTLSGAKDGEQGSMMELTTGGKQSVAVGNGEQRFFLADGDELTLRAVAHREGFRSIGFGTCAGQILAANWGGMCE